VFYVNPNASIAFNGGILKNGGKSYPLIFGGDVWMQRPEVISQRKLSNGQYERVQILSVGRLGNDNCGEIQQIDTNFYNDCGQPIGTITDWRPGLVTQPNLPITGIWNDCDCSATNGSNLNVVGSSVEFTVEVTDNLPHSWNILVNGVINISLTVPGNGLYPVQISSGLPGIVNLVPTGVNPVTAKIINFNFQSGALTNFPGLCVVLTKTTCPQPPSFRVISGKSVENIVEAGIFDGSPITTQPGEIIRNLTSGLPTFNIGDFYYVYQVGDSKYLPDIYAYLNRQIGGGLNYISKPDAFLDYIRLKQSRDFCVANDYKFSGLLTTQNMLKFAQLAAPQSGLILTRTDNRVGYIPDEPVPCKFVFNGSNASGFKYFFNNWDEHATNRLIVRYGSKLDRTVIVETDSVTTGQISLTEEYLEWAYVNDINQVEILARNYFKAIRGQDRGIEFTASTSVFNLEVGDIFEASNPDWETDDESSGYLKGQALTVVGTASVFDLDTQTYLNGLTDLSGYSKNSPYIMGTNHYFYRCAAIEPISTKEYKIIGTRWNADLYDGLGLRVIS
jgi:hypothetical protein